MYDGFSDNSRIIITVGILHSIDISTEEGDTHEIIAGLCIQ